MRLIADYHTHSTYSDGEGSMENNVLAAMARGFKRVAITDHGPGHVLYGARRGKFQAMRREADALSEKFAGRIEVLLGLELNLLSLEGDTDMPDSRELFDLFLLGYHRAALLKTGLISFGAAKHTRKAVKRNTLAFCRAIERYPIDIIAHPGEYVPLDIEVLAAAAASAGTAFEINSSHEVTTREHVEIAKAQGVQFALGSDAHTPGRVGDFEIALGVAVEGGLSADDIVNADGAAAERFLERISRKR